MILAKITDSTSDKGVTYSEVVSGAGSTLDKVAYVVVPGAALAKFTSAIKFSGISVVEVGTSHSLFPGSPQYSSTW